MEREAERRAVDESDDRERQEAEEEKRAVEDFERVQMGLEAKGMGGTIVGRDGGKVTVEREVEGVDGKNGVKRKFEFDEEEVMRVAREERSKLRKTLSDEKVGLSSNKVWTLWLMKTPTARSHFQVNASLLLGALANARLQHGQQRLAAHSSQEGKAEPDMPGIFG